MSLQDELRDEAKGAWCEGCPDATEKYERLFIEAADELDRLEQALKLTERQVTDAMTDLNFLGFECEQVKKELATVRAEGNGLRWYLDKRAGGRDLLAVELRAQLAAVTAERDALKKDAEERKFWVPCQGVAMDGCDYLATCGMMCNKCGRVHRQ
jgi:hypothetical protein